MLAGVVFPGAWPWVRLGFWKRFGVNICGFMLNGTGDRLPVYLKKKMPKTILINCC